MGPFGGIAVMALLILSLVKWNYLVPGRYYDMLNQRNELLESENSTQNKDIVELVRHNAKLEVQIERLNTEVHSLMNEVKQLRSEVGHHG